MAAEPAEVEEEAPHRHSNIPFSRVRSLGKHGPSLPVPPALQKQLTRLRRSLQASVTLPRPDRIPYEEQLAEPDVQEPEPGGGCSAGCSDASQRPDDVAGLAVAAACAPACCDGSALVEPTRAEGGDARHAALDSCAADDGQLLPTATEPLPPTASLPPPPPVTEPPAATLPPPSSSCEPNMPPSPSPRERAPGSKPPPLPSPAAPPSETTPPPAAPEQRLARSKDRLPEAGSSPLYVSRLDNQATILRVAGPGPGPGSGYGSGASPGSGSGSGFLRGSAVVGSARPGQRQRSQTPPQARPGTAQAAAVYTAAGGGGSSAPPSSSGMLLAVTPYRQQQLQRQQQQQLEQERLQLQQQEQQQQEQQQQEQLRLHQVQQEQLQQREQRQEQRSSSQARPPGSDSRHDDDRSLSSLVAVVVAVAENPEPLPAAATATEQDPCSQPSAVATATEQDPCPQPSSDQAEVPDAQPPPEQPEELYCPPLHPSPYQAELPCLMLPPDASPYQAEGSSSPPPDNSPCQAEGSSSPPPDASAEQPCCPPPQQPLPDQAEDLGTLAEAAAEADPLNDPLAPQPAQWPEAGMEPEPGPAAGSRPGSVVGSRPGSGPVHLDYCCPPPAPPLPPLPPAASPSPLLPTGVHTHTFQRGSQSSSQGGGDGGGGEVAPPAEQSMQASIELASQIVNTLKSPMPGAQGDGAEAQGVSSVDDSPAVQSLHATFDATSQLIDTLKSLRPGAAAEAAAAAAALLERMEGEDDGEEVYQEDLDNEGGGEAVAAVAAPDGVQLRSAAVAARPSAEFAPPRMVFDAPVMHSPFTAWDHTLAEPQADASAAATAATATATAAAPGRTMDVGPSFNCSRAGASASLPAAAGEGDDDDRGSGGEEGGTDRGGIADDYALRPRSLQLLQEKSAFSFKMSRDLALGTPEQRDKSPDPLSRHPRVEAGAGGDGRGGAVDLQQQQQAPLDRPTTVHYTVPAEPGLSPRRGGRAGALPHMAGMMMTPHPPTARSAAQQHHAGRPGPSANTSPPPRHHNVPAHAPVPSRDEALPDRPTTPMLTPNHHKGTSTNDSAAAAGGGVHHAASTARRHSETRMGSAYFQSGGGDWAASRAGGASPKGTGSGGPGLPEISAPSGGSYRPGGQPPGEWVNPEIHAVLHAHV